MIVGSHRDRKKTASTTIKQFGSVANHDVPGALGAKCYNAFHRKEDADKYHKTWKLQSELDQIFAMRPKVSPERAREIMKEMTNPKDGGLFCWAKHGEFVARKHPAYKDWVGCSVCNNQEKSCDCNGMLLSVAQINSAWSGRAAKEKKARQDAGEEELDYSAARGRTLED